MAVVARSPAQQSRQHTFPFEHEADLQDDRIQMPFLFPQPQLPPLRDSRKAQKMLGLVTEFPRPRSATLEVPARDPTKAQRTLGLVTDLPRDRNSWRRESGQWSGGYKGSLEERLAQAERDVRRLSGLDMEEMDELRDAVEKNDEQEGEEQQHVSQQQPTTKGWLEVMQQDEFEQRDSMEQAKAQVEINILHSPEQLSQSTPIEQVASPEQMHVAHCLPRQGVPRPPSCASSHLLNRPTNKIASSRSRGLRANSYPNFSRPLSAIAPKPVPGEDMERDPLYMHFDDDDEEEERPADTPASPVGGLLLSDQIRAAREKVEQEKRMKMHSPVPPTPTPAPVRTHKPRKARWSSLPVSLMKFAKRSSRTEDEGKGKKSKADLTEDNLQRWEDEVGYVPKMHRLGYDILRSPVEVDMEVERGTPDPAAAAIRLPELPKMENLTLTPPTSPPLIQHEHATAPIAIKATSVLPTPPTSPPLSQQLFTPRSIASSALPSPPPNRTSSLAVQKEYMFRATTPPLTCTVCKEAEHPSAFPSRPITGTCTHTAQTCLECLRGWIENCVDTRGWDRCTCPECGQNMSYDDVQAFAPEAMFNQYDNLALRSILASLSDFYWCQSPKCTSGQIHGGSAIDDPVFTCTACGHVHCLVHPTVPYHFSETCAQYEARIDEVVDLPGSIEHKYREEKEGQKLVQETSKRCPNAMCGWWIQKNEGCDHMTCWKCRFEFCWECGAPFGVIDKKGNKFHRRTCKYWG